MNRISGTANTEILSRVLAPLIAAATPIGKAPLTNSITSTNTLT